LLTPKLLSPDRLESTALKLVVVGRNLWLGSPFLDSYLEYLIFSNLPALNIPLPHYYSKEPLKTSLILKLKSSPTPAKKPISFKDILDALNYNSNNSTGCAGSILLEDNKASAFEQFRLR
jgi:hypothetical protein